MEECSSSHINSRGWRWRWCHWDTGGRDDGGCIAAHINGHDRFKPPLPW